jgi:hypothetical protein
VHVAQVHEGVQEAAGGGAAQPGGGGDLGEAEHGVFGVERANDGETAFQRLDEVAVGRGYICGDHVPFAAFVLHGASRTGLE